jgi:hypothetical protein
MDVVLRASSVITLSYSAPDEVRRRAGQRLRRPTCKNRLNRVDPARRSPLFDTRAKAARDQLEEAQANYHPSSARTAFSSPTSAWTWSRPA